MIKKAKTKATKIFRDSSRELIKFRLFAYQPLSIKLVDPKPFALTIQNIDCHFVLRPAHTDASRQRNRGGTYITVDFSLSDDVDLLLATRRGLDLIEDFLSGLSLVEGALFGDVKPVQLIRTDSILPPRYSLVHFLDLYLHHWNGFISTAKIHSVQGLLAHWDGLDIGQRLRRAARQYNKALQAGDPLAAFQHAYMGLEALEKPLANIMKITPGVELVKGKCKNCGAEYSRVRTALSGVRAYVCGQFHPEKASATRKNEWKEINDLRQKIFHSLTDRNQMTKNVQKALPAAMHYLHDAICCLSHEHGLESEMYRLVRGIHRIVLIGTFTSNVDLASLKRWRPSLQAKGYWVKDPQYGFITQFKIIKKSGLNDLQAIFYWLTAPLESATEANLSPANWRPS